MTAFASNPESHPLSSRLLLAHLRSQARARLQRLRGRDPAARLADAERDVAEAHGFRSWRALKSALERQAALAIRACAGCYRDDPARIANHLLKVRLEGGSLIVQSLSGAAMTLQRQADGRFAAPGLGAAYGFARDEDGAVIAMTVDIEGRQSRLQRIDQAEAEAIAAAHRLALADQARPRQALALPPEMLAPHAGHYAGGHGLTVEITLEDGRLLAGLAGQRKLPLAAESETDFFFPMMAAQLRFGPGREHSATAALHRHGTITYLSRIAPEETPAAAMARRFADQIRPRVALALPPGCLPRYAGCYRLDAGRTLTLEAEGEHLFARITGQARYEIYAEAQDRFFWTVVPAQLSFVPDDSGGIGHAILHQGGDERVLARLA